MLLVGLLLLGSSLSLARPTSATSGGPDAYGYIWVDSRPPSPTLPFNWVDITTSGTRLLLADDACTYEIPIRFQFRFYGVTVDQAYVCSNGFITFSVPYSFNADPPIPSPNPPNDRIVALGLDLNPAASGSGGVYFRSEPTRTPQRFIITWQGVYRAFTTSPQTFQIILEQNLTAEDGRITFQYRTLTGVTSALVGIENSTGSSGLAYPGSLGNSLTVGFLPPSDAALPPDQMSVAATVLAPPTVAQGSGNVPMLALDFATATNWVDVTSIDVTLSGLGAGPEDVPRASLWLETNGDNVFTPGPDVFVAYAVFSGAPATASLDPPSLLRVAVGAPRRVYIAYDLASTAGVGDWIGARLPDATSVLVSFPDRVGSAGFPVDSYMPTVRTRIVASADTLSLTSAKGRLPAALAQWDTDRPILSLNVAANRNSVDLAGIRVRLGGGVVAQDVWAVKAVRDADGDGNYTPEVDDVLAFATPSGSPPQALLSFNLTVVAGAPVSLLLALDVAPDAVLGHNLTVTVQSADLLLPPGSADRVDAANFPASSGNGTIVPGQRPALALPWSYYAPTADGVWRFDEYVLAPSSTVSLYRPGGNPVAGVLTVENNGTTLFIAIGAIHDLAAEAGDGAAIAFDTDRNGAPTDGADDVFAVNATGGIHEQYSAGASRWTTVAPCNPGPNASAASCAAAIGFTQVGKSAHQFYEFAIPLATLGVPDPIPAGTSLRFAVAGPPYNGLADKGNRTTWPLLFGAPAPLAYFADLNLIVGPTPNQPPSLNWTGEPGYETDGLEPEAGAVGDGFLWKVAYFDPDNDPPALGFPRLHVLRNDVDIASSPVEMMGQDAGDANYRDGKVYVRLLSLQECGGVYSYYFTTRDARGLPIPAAETPRRLGPAVRCPDEPPVLSGEDVTPFIANTGTSFTYRVAYQDTEGQPPAAINVSVQWGGVDLTSVPLRLVGWLGDTGNYTQGAWYEESIALQGAGTNYTFRFQASDGNVSVTTSWFLGPYVTVPPPHLLSVLSRDLAPAIADEGARLVPFLRLTLSTSDPEVDVASVLFDRAGTASVDEVLLYNDTDGTASLTPSDVLLGVRSGAPTQVSFDVSVRVVPSLPTYLLLLANLTGPGTADASVGFEVRDTSYFVVGPGDAVSPFPPIRSTRTLVNVPPVAAGLTVDGYAVGSPGISHIASGAPTLAWRFQDENSADVAPSGYNASVWSAVPPQTLLWFRNESVGATSAVYGGPALADGGTYLLRVRVTDGRLWSPTAEVSFRMNRPPPAPTLLAPVNTTTGVGAQVTLQWNAVVDADGDPITYEWWASETPAFSPSLQGVTTATSVGLTLSLGKTYYWKVGASDGYEFAGNATVWWFEMAPPIVPVFGEIRGRVLNGTTPLMNALVQLLVGSSVVAANITAPNGTFLLRDLALRAYSVRISAFGFQPQTIQAEPTQSSPVVDLGDIALTPSGGTDGNPPPGGIPGWLLAAIAAVLATAVTVAFLSLFLVLRRRRREAPAKIAPAEAKEEVPREPTASSADEALYECPVCGREVTPDATRCECGAIFER